MIVEFQFATPEFEPSSHEASTDAVAIEGLDAIGGGGLRGVFRAETAALASDGALTDQPMVEDASALVTSDHGTLYYAVFDPEFSASRLYRNAVTRGGLFLGGRAVDTQFELRMRFPDRDAVARFRDDCASLDIDLSVEAIYESDSGQLAGQFGLSQPQREALLLAVERGYFKVPRQASLADLADVLGVSSQAASERLRRGLDSLVEQTLLIPGR